MNGIAGDIQVEESFPKIDQSVLISKAQSGDSQAFNALVEPYLSRIYWTAMQITKNHEDAEDACQESMLKAFVHLPTFQGNAKFSTWLTRIAMNEALMALRKLRTESRHICNENDTCALPVLEEISDSSIVSNPEALCVQKEWSELLWGAIDQLEAKSKVAVCQFGMEDKKTGEIAQETNLSYSGVRSRLARALRKLRIVLETKVGCRKQQIPRMA